MYRKYKEPDYMPTQGEMLKILNMNTRLQLSSETVQLEESLGRVCAVDIYSKRKLPNSPVSIIDGIAVRYKDFSDAFPDTSAWCEGDEFYFSNTGVAVRDDFDTVIPIEDIEYIYNKLTIMEKPEKLGAYVGAAGASVRENELLARKGTRLTPKHIGLLAAGGILEVEVLKQPVVAILPTGNELVSADEETPRGKNVDSNSHMLSAYVLEWGGYPIRYPIITDDKELILSALRKAVDESDIVILIGGSSKGTMDYSIEAVKQIGRVVVEELGHGPGKHASLCLAGDKIVLGLPGPFMGALLVAELYLRLVLDQLLMQPNFIGHSLDVILINDLGRYEIDFVEMLHIYCSDEKYYAESVYNNNPKTWAEAIAVNNGRFYHKKGVVFRAGDHVQAELLVPLAYIPKQ